MYSIVEITDSPEDGVFVIKELPGYHSIPEDEIDYVVNLLRLEDRKVMAVRDVPREDPFEDPGEPSAGVKWSKRFLAATVLLSALGSAWLYARNTGMLDGIVS